MSIHTARRTFRTALATGALATTTLVGAAWPGVSAPAANEAAKAAVAPVRAPAIDARLFVSPYQDRIRADGGLVLGDLRLRVLDGVNEMSAEGVTTQDDRICLDVHDAARGFSPAMVKIADSDALELAKALEGAAGGPLAAAFERANDVRGMTVMFGTQPYARDGFGVIDLPDDVTFFVQDAYHGIDDDQRPFIDDRVILAVADDAKAFWPLVLRLDRAIVKALAIELREAVGRRAR